MTLSVLLVVVVITSIVVCKFRFEFWLLSYRLAKYRLRNKNFVQGDKEFAFNAFVSYSSADEEWVLNELMDNLENSSNETIRLCLHERDFKIGLPIAENIVLHLEQSATCIMVVSEKFTQSYWCNFELQVAHKMFEEQSRQNKLVIFWALLELMNHYCISALLIILFYGQYEMVYWTIWCCLVNLLS